MNSRELATLTSYPEEYTSNIDGIHAFSLKGVSIKNELQNLRSHFRQTLQNLEEDTKKDQQTVTVHYDPQAFKSKEEIEVTLHTDAQAEGRFKAQKWRTRTKHRTITSQVTCYANSYGHQIKNERDEIVPTFPITLTTGCAPNFMGSSQGDQDHFLKGIKTRTIRGREQLYDGELKDPAYYQATMKLLFKRWLAEQDANAVDVLIIPLVGGGAYLSILSDAAKADALKRIHSALFEAVAESQLNHISEIIYALPDENPGGIAASRTKTYDEACNLLRQYAGKLENEPAITIANVDALDAAAGIATRKNKKAGLINPGSDRTMGGYYAQVAESGIHADKSPTFEEIVFNLTNASEVQTLDLNKQNMTFMPYADELLAKTLHERSPVAKKPITASPRHQQASSQRLPKKDETSKSGPGKFVPFTIEYQTPTGDSISALDQAEKLLSQIAYLHELYPQQKIGITYSANHDQTVAIREAYKDGWRTGIGGANQAKVIQMVELIFAGKAKSPEVQDLTKRYKHLRHTFRILPISTSAHTNGKGKTKERWLEQDLTAIEEFAKNNIVIGWKNQDSHSKKSYAIGGSISGEDIFPKVFSDKVQTRLQALATVRPCEDRDSTPNKATSIKNGGSTANVRRKLEEKNPPKPASQSINSPALSQEAAEQLAKQLLETFKQLEGLLKKIDTELDRLIEEKKKNNAEQTDTPWRPSTPSKGLSSID